MKQLDFFLSLSDLLDQDISSYEYFYSLPAEIQQRIREQDISSFSDMQACVKKMTDSHSAID